MNEGNIEQKYKTMYEHELLKKDKQIETIKY